MAGIRRKIIILALERRLKINALYLFDATDNYFIRPVLQVTSEGGEGSGGCWDNNTVWLLRGGGEYRAMTRSDMATLHGWTNFALWAKKISRNIPTVSSVYWRPTTCPVRSSSSSSRPECHSSWTNSVLIPPSRVSAAHAASSARLPVYLGWWTFQFTFLCRLGGFYNNARPGRRGWTNNIS